MQDINNSMHAFVNSLSFIDRSLVVIKPKQVFVDWLNSLPSASIELTLEQIRVDCTALLVEASEEPEGTMAWVYGNASNLFKLELSSWDDDQQYWPTDLSVENFCLWFDIEIHSTVIDAYEEQSQSLKN